MFRYTFKKTIKRKIIEIKSVEAKIIEKHDFGDGKARYELITAEHHDHLVNIKTGEIVEFYNEKLEKLKTKIASDLGYKLIDHRLELFVVPKKK